MHTLTVKHSNRHRTWFVSVTAIKAK